MIDWLGILKAGFVMTQLMIPVFYSRLDNENQKYSGLGLSIVKMLPREVVILPGKKTKFPIFRLKYYKSIPNIKICLNEVQALEQSHQIC